MSEAPVSIDLSRLDPHPQNPRLVRRDDVIEAISASMTAQGFDPAHALIVRPVGDRFQVISGHNRREAAIRAGLETVPAWVRPMDDAAAYMELVRANAQGELTALERGMHALGATEKGKHGQSVKAYAGAVGRAPQTVALEVQAARVAAEVSTRVETSEIVEKHRHLAEIHAAPRWLWPALVERLVTEGLTVEATRKVVADLKDVEAPPSWAGADDIASAIVSGEMRKAEVEKMGAAVERATTAIEKAALDAVHYRDGLMDALDSNKPSRLAAVLDICDAWIDAQERALEEQRQRAAAERRKEVESQRAVQEREARIAKLKSNVSLEVWNDLDTDTKAMLLDTSRIETSSSFNRQDSGAIEWAQFSWNPVTGCLHDCPYCYARDIALNSRMEKVYPNGFAPSFRPASLLAPANTKVPREAQADTRFRNVFTCSMADLFGRWVPAEWINAVLSTARDNAQWNYLFLTKFPKRMSEFTIPDNCWMGTTVDLQVRVKNAEAAFANVGAGVRWLSVEPLLEPLRFSRMDLFQWIVIGGASRSSKTPEWHPPFEWIADLVRQAREAGTKVYFKTNLLGNRVLELPFDAPIAADPVEAPAIFHYLGGKSASARKDANLLPEVAA